MINFLIVFALLFHVGATKRLTVAGKLECCLTSRTPCPIYTEPTTVQLWEKNKVLSDKLLTTSMSDPVNGNFIVSVPNDNNILDFKPYVRILHRCNAKPVGFLFRLNAL